MAGGGFGITSLMPLVVTPPSPVELSLTEVQITFQVPITRTVTLRVQTLVRYVPRANTASKPRQNRGELAVVVQVSSTILKIKPDCRLCSFFKFADLKRFKNLQNLSRNKDII